MSAERAQTLMDRARATGLIEPSHSPHFLRSVHRAVAQIAGNARHRDIESALLRSQVAMSTMSPALALRLAEHGMSDAGLAETLRKQAGAVRAEPAAAARLYRAAVDAGATDLRPQLADALALCGESQAAASEADGLLGSADPGERAVAVRVAASVAAHNGNYAQAAELFTWLGPYPDAVISAAAAVVLTAVGDAGGARTALAVDNAGPPTAASRAARTLADGLLATIDGPYAGAATKLGQAMAAEFSPTQVLPDSPAALVTLAALHGGDAVRARSVISRAVRAGTGGNPLHAHRHRLLLAWTKMQDGQLSGAGSDLAGIDEAGLDVAGRSGSGLQRRDALWAAALRTAIARRGGDTGAVHKHWYAAMEVLAEYSVDLFSLLPLGELWMAAARIHQQDRLTPVLEQAFRLLHALGDPPAWSVPLHWAGVHAGILANDPAAVAPHGQALTAAAAHDPFARALAGAGRTWLRVLAGQVEPDEVNTAAQRPGSVRAHLGRHPTGRAGGTAGVGPEGVRADAADRPRPEAVGGRQLGRRRRRRGGPARSDRPSAVPVPRRRRCPTVSARWPNCCCWACPTATSAPNCSSPPRPLNTTSHASAAVSAPNPVRRCCRCCGRSWPRKCRRDPRPSEVRTTYVAVMMGEVPV